MKATCFIAILPLALTIQAQVNLNSSLTACYALDGNGNEPVNSLTGTLSAAITNTVDRFNIPNNALHFPGTVGQVVLLPDNSLIKPSNAISVSLWVKPESLNWMELVYTKNIYSAWFSAYALTFQDNGQGYKFRIYRQDGNNDNTVDAVTTVTAANVWYHVVMTIDNNSMNLYVNGVLENSASCFITNYNYQSGKEVVLGGTNESASDFPFMGSMDNVRFYNRVINAAEVSALYSQDPRCNADVPSGITETGIASQITVFPSIVNNVVNVYSRLSYDHNWMLMDALGKKIKQGVLRSNSVIDMSSETKGLYFLIISNDKEKIVKKVIKE